MQAIIWIFFITLIALSLSLVWATFLYGISPMPTSTKVKKTLLKELPLNYEGILFELGSGWGTLAFPLAEKYPQAQVVAYEISWLPYLFCKGRQLFKRHKNLVFKREDFFKVSFTGTHFFICYLFPKAMERLNKKFRQEAASQTLIISHTFALPSQKPKRLIFVKDLYHTPIYFYTFN
ncbi:Uncharacterized protein PHSC3_001485 [Chlamydiales bacterium STE3]|nr:Uncharacterized protein PHSC3_001485 [Chlamydiales bacterium STE3]